MATLFADPFNALFQFQQALDAFRTSGWLGSGPSSAGAYPPFNVFRQGDDIVLITEVPGIRKSDLDIQVKGNTIRISALPAARPSNTATPQRCIVASGSPDGSIARSRYRSKSTRTGSRPNTETGFWPSISRAPSGTSRNRSLWDDHRGRSLGLSLGG